MTIKKNFNLLKSKIEVREVFFLGQVIKGVKRGGEQLTIQPFVDRGCCRKNLKKERQDDT